MDEKHTLTVDIKVDGRSLQRIKQPGPSLGILLYSAGTVGDLIWRELKTHSDMVYHMKTRYDAEESEGGSDENLSDD